MPSTVLEVSVHDESRGFVKRRLLRAPTPFEVVNAICGLLPVQCTEGYTGCHVRLRETQDMLHDKELGFTNICGKVVHDTAWHNRPVHAPAVAGWLLPERNTFGPSLKLCSPNSTLITCNDSSVTRFCGGVSFEKTLEVLEIAIERESVSSMTLHMVVANEHIGRPVQTSSPQVLEALSADKRWATQRTFEHEDISFVAGFLLSSFDAALLEQQAGFALPFLPLAVRVMVSRRGKVNYFVALDSVPMQRHVEVQQSVRHVLAQIKRVLLQAT